MFFLTCDFVYILQTLPNAQSKDDFVAPVHRVVELSGVSGAKSVGGSPLPAQSNPAAAVPNADKIYSGMLLKKKHKIC